MRVLQINKKFPYPLHDGESIAVNSLARGLVNAGATVDLFALNTTKHFYNFDDQDRPVELSHYDRIQTSTIDTGLEINHLFRDLFSSSAYQVDRFFDEKAGNQLKLMMDNTEYDIVQFESIFTLPYLSLIRKHSKVKLVLRAHNLEHEIWNRMAAAGIFFLRPYYRLMSKKLNNYECRMVSKTDLIMPVSEHDLRSFQKIGFNGPSVIVPIGIPYRPEYLMSKASAHNGPVIGFIGSLDWRPNANGLKWFLKQVYPDLVRTIPGLTFKIAGRNSPLWLDRIELDGVLLEGEVSDSMEFMKELDLLVVPLWAGSGTRVKILEAFTSGVPVVSTTIGAEGLEAKNGHHIMIADDGHSFCDSIREVINEPSKAKALIAAGRRLVRNRNDIDQVGRKVYVKYLEMLKKNTL